MFKHRAGGVASAARKKPKYAYVERDGVMVEVAL
jgi:hypothetical protein